MADLDRDTRVAAKGVQPRSSGGHAETCPPYRTAQARSVRALWVAGPAAARLVSDSAARQGFFDFCEAPHGNSAARITTLYLEPPDDCGQAGLRAFLAAAHPRGLQVEFLFRDADWRPDQLAGAKATCEQRLEAFGAAAPAAERFDGIHLYLEDGGNWSQRAFHGLLLYLRQKIDGYNSRQTHQMTLAADLGFWWPERGDDSRPQFAEAVRQCDYVVSLAYRDTAGAQASCAVPQALAAGRQGKGFCIGVETQRLVDQDAATYFEEGWEQMEGELAKLPALLAAQGSALAGIAIHDYDSYAELRREPLVSPFPDVRLDHWAFFEIVAARQAGIIGGYPDGSYRPASAVRRDEMAAFIAHALVGAPNVPEGPPQPSFPDVPRDYWAYKYIECAKAHDVVVGHGDSQYHPTDKADRGQMAAFVARAMVTPTGEVGLAGYVPPVTPTFADVTPGSAWSWCYQHVEYLAAQGIATGYPDGLYHPEQPCTRDQIAVYLVKAFRLPCEG